MSTEASRTALLRQALPDWEEYNGFFYPPGTTDGSPLGTAPCVTTFADTAEFNPELPFFADLGADSDFVDLPNIDAVLAWIEENL